MAALPSPKLVIMAGSNGPYSHSCVVMSVMLNMPCENAGIAVGIGLDDIFVRYEPLLHAGDVVYMPMELQQYTMSAAAYRAAVDGAFLLRHDRHVLAQLPLSRVVGAVFCCGLGDLTEALAEMPLAEASAIKPEALLAEEYDEQGDRTDNGLYKRDAALLPLAPRALPSAEEIYSGYGSALIAAFVTKEARTGVIVIGGMPVDYVAAHVSGEVTSVIADIYVGNGGRFVVLPNQSEYPRADFFNSEDHLVQPCQYMHSIYLARRLGVLLRRPVLQLSTAITDIAAACPFAEGAD
jgi:hypothetical protein